MTSPSNIDSAPRLCILAMDFCSRWCGAIRHTNKNTIWWSDAQTVYKASCNGCLDAKCNRAAEFHLFHKLGRHYARPDKYEVSWPSFWWHVYYVLQEKRNKHTILVITQAGPLAGPFRETGRNFVLWLLSNECCAIEQPVFRSENLCAAQRFCRFLLSASRHVQKNTLQWT